MSVLLTSGIIFAITLKNFLTILAPDFVSPSLPVYSVFHMLSVYRRTRQALQRGITYKSDWALNTDTRIICGGP